jgi:mercuric ion binding protein
MKIAQTLSIIVATTITALTLSPAFAASKTVTLSVPSMYCEMCPITVKKALNKIEGVNKVDASFEKKEAVVTFDDDKTTVKALTKATEDAGYPSHVVDTHP